VVTDASGMAEVRWTLGAADGDQTVTATVAGDGASATFHATAHLGTLILRYDGSQWSTHLADSLSASTLDQIQGIRGSSTTSVFASAVAIGPGGYRD
jgi:hypothetical protein